MKRDLIIALIGIVIAIIIGASWAAAVRSGHSSTTPPPATTGTATTTVTVPPNTTVITNADRQTTIRLPVGSRFVVALGSDMHWTVAFDPASSITRVGDANVSGSQGLYEADTAGTVTLTATGAPICIAGEACPQYLVNVTVTLVVATAETTSDGTITFATLADFGLATDADQVVIKSYIPSCDDGFAYCLYYDGAAYTGSNFESAGIRIAKRPDLTTSALCLTTAPDGYTNLAPTTSSGAGYTASVFPTGDAGAGHYASGDEYRVYLNATGTCYQFDTRVGETQFANYPAGTVTEFTDAERDALLQRLTTIVSAIMIPGGKTLTLPTPPAQPAQ